MSDMVRKVGLTRADMDNATALVCHDCPTWDEQVRDCGLPIGCPRPGKALQALANAKAAGIEAFRQHAINRLQVWHTTSLNEAELRGLVVKLLPEEKSHE